jgi:hypothetical protein
VQLAPPVIPHNLKAGDPVAIAFVETKDNLFPEIEWIDTAIQKDVGSRWSLYKWETQEGNVFDGLGYGSRPVKGGYRTADPRLLLLPPGTRKPVWSMD